MNKWPTFFLQTAEHISHLSKDPSTKCGAVICDDKNRIVSMGYNGGPIGIDDEWLLSEGRDRKIATTIHAEVNAILFARGSTWGNSIYIYPLPPCSNCASLIIQSGIKKAYFLTGNPQLREQWNCDLSLELFDRAKVEWEIL